MKKSLFFPIFLFSLFSFLFSLAPKAQAACNFHAAMTATIKDLTVANNNAWTTACTVTGIEGLDKTDTEGSTTNTAALTLGAGGNITLNAGASLITGSLVLGGGNIAIADTAQIKVGAPLYVADADADGWPTDFTLYTATASGRRRLALMRAFGTADCGDGTYSVANSCTGGTGSDGACTVSSHININTQSCVGRAYGDGIAYGLTSIGSNYVTTGGNFLGINIGDKVILHNRIGNTSYYGNVGNYEILEVSNVSGNTIWFTTSISKVYGAAGSNADLTGQSPIIQRIPQYTDVTINNGIWFYPYSWSGFFGTGLIAFYASGTVTVNGIISTAGYGYRGGPHGVQNGTRATGGEAFCGYAAGGYGGIWDSGGHALNSSCGGGSGAGFLSEIIYGTATGGAGGAGGARGGIYNHGGSGGGGGYGGAGGGGYSTYNYQNGTGGGTDTSGQGGSLTSWWDGSQNIYVTGGGGGGGTYGSTNLTKLYYGSGGGGGGPGYCDGNIGDGGAGGGIVYIVANNLIVNGTISASGASGTNGHTWGGNSGGCGAGGGGAGGSIYLVVSSANIGTNLVTATGGAGGTVSGGSWPGGAGGSGRIVIDGGTVTGTTNPTYTAL